MQKIVKAVQPYIFEGKINFKYKPYDAWVALGGKTAKSHYPPRCLHGLAYRLELPQLRISKREARLRFMQPYSLNFDTFPDTAFYEIIPFFWDVWPDNFEKVSAWLKVHKVKSAIFTSSQVAEMVNAVFPTMNVLAITEGIDCKNYKKGKDLKCRSIDFFEYGRHIDRIVTYNRNNINYQKAWKGNKISLSYAELIDSLANSKVIASYPKSLTNPEWAGNIETLTQRYWEGMLSRSVMIGHAPKELVDLLGYNPIIELDTLNPDKQLRDILGHIDNYQSVVDKNRDMALKYGDWKYSVNKIMEWLNDLGYKI